MHETLNDVLVACLFRLEEARNKARLAGYELEEAKREYQKAYKAVRDNNKFKNEVTR